MSDLELQVNPHSSSGSGRLEGVDNAALLGYTETRRSQAAVQPMTSVQPTQRIDSSPAVQLLDAGVDTDYTALSSAAPPPSRRTSILRDGQGRRFGHRIPGTQYFALAVWLTLLALNYGLTRMVCKLGVPQDCHAQTDWVKVMKDFEQVLFAGTGLAILTGLHWPDRFQYIFCFSRPKPRGVSFLFIFFGMSPGWGLLGMAPTLISFTLEWDSPSSSEALLLLIGVCAIFLVVWHIVIAFRYNSWSGFFSYFGSRLLLMVFYSGYVLAKLSDSKLDFHLHHYVVAFMAATLAEFNHPLSLILLAAASGVFIQGISAYDADPVIQHKQVRLMFEDNGREVYSPFISVEAADFFLDHCR